MEWGKEHEQSLIPETPSVERLHNCDTRGNLWRPGFWQRFPTLAVISLFGVLACTAAAIGILASSDQRPVQEWKSSMSPSVYLASLSIAANALLAVALAEGLVISFWRTLARGCSIQQLNDHWLSGHSFQYALVKSWSKAGVLPGLACIFSIISLLRGPLNQRASQVSPNVQFPTAGTMQIHSTPELPDAYSGINPYSRSPSRTLTARLTPVFIEIMQEYSQNRNISFGHSPCGSTCDTTIKGFGFRPVCSKKNITWNEDSAGLNRPIFDTSVDLQLDDDVCGYSSMNCTAQVRLNATFHEGTNTIEREVAPDGTLGAATGYLTQHSCVLEAGIVAYQVRINDDTVSLRPNGSGDEFLSSTTLESLNNNYGGSIVGGFQYAGDFVFNSTATWNFGGAVSSSTLIGSLANQKLALTEDSNSYFSFSDPMPDMIAGLREIAFRASIRAGRDNNTLPGALQEVGYTGSDEHAIYVTDRRYMAAGAVISIISAIAVAATLWGWWELGRNVSMSPLEIAKAFGSPLLDKMGSNVSWSKMPKDLAMSNVRFGEHVALNGFVGGAGQTGTPQLVIARDDDVRRPVPGRMYS